MCSRSTEGDSGFEVDGCKLWSTGDPAATAVNAFIVDQNGLDDVHP